MKSTLIIKDLTTDKQLDSKMMSTVRGGNGNQANGTLQSNKAELCAPVAVGNGTDICGPATFQVDSNPTQTLSNCSTSTNDKSLGLYGVCLPAC
ncbi:MAG: hypothetical protein ACXU8A_08250 [Burkholderiaceae bacterium]